ncbi:hypothetical protein [Acuticoccus kandeliae]|uniref:hypothetical protein n=1 Tax=Acuticoccus kandeliae TaxID=2073160 RepID=UPI000D3E2608|nr:hypothetical protein [Acuticoccus kandeliae]
MTRTCRTLIGLFAILYFGALALFAIGALGLFGQERDPLAGVFLLPLGLPWNVLFLEGLPDWALFVSGLAAPLVNLAILILLCRYFSKRRACGA